MSTVMEQYYEKLFDLMLSPTGKIKVNKTFHKQMGQIKTLLGNDKTGLVSTLIDFMIHASNVDITFNSSNPKMNKLLANWKDNVNANLSIDIPRGLRSFAEQYFRERWQSSFIAVNIRWEVVDGYWLPKKMYIMDGASIYCENDKGNLNTNRYFLGKPNEKKSNELRNTETTSIIIRKPYNQLYDQYPTPYLIKKGALYHSLFKIKVLERQADIIQTAFPYQLLIKVGTQDAIKKGIGPSQAQLEEIKQKFQNQKKNFDEHVYSKGVVGAFAGDVNLEEIIPDYIKALDEKILKSADKNILYALGMIEFKGFSSNREEAMLNPKVLVEEVEDAVKDYNALMSEIIMQMQEKNIKRYKSQDKIEVQSGVIKTFLTDNMKTLIRSWFDRGLVGYKSGLENTTGLDFETQFKERQKETKEKITTVCYPRLVQNMEKYPDKENIPDDKNPDTPESKNYKNAKECITKEFESINDIPEFFRNRIEDDKLVLFMANFNKCFNYCTKLDMDNELREKTSLEFALDYLQAPYTKDNYPKSIEKLPQGAKTIWINTFNKILKETKDEDKARKIAWTNVKKKYKKENNKWVKK